MLPWNRFGQIHTKWITSEQLDYDEIVDVLVEVMYWRQVEGFFVNPSADDITQVAAMMSKSAGVEWTKMTETEQREWRKSAIIAIEAVRWPRRIGMDRGT